MSESTGSRRPELARLERGTKYLFGRPYHWGHDDAGEKVLLPGPDPREGAR